MRLLTFSTLYPSAARPQHGIFVENRLRHLVGSGRAVSTVLAPVPWYPAWAPKRRGWDRYASIARIEHLHGLEVHHPRYVAIPRVGMNLAPATLAACALAWLRRQGASRRAAFDLVDAHYVYPDGVAALAVARRLGRPLVLTARGSDLTELPDYAGPRRMIRHALRRADGLIAVSAALGARLIELGAEPGRVRVLRNGVDLERFAPPADRAAARAALGLDGPTLLSVGHLIERKGHDRVIEALARLPSGVRLLIAGDGPCGPSLRALAARIGVADRVRFLGLLAPDALPAYYGASDALVLASSREGWANVLLESMACGTAVVASPIPGNDEVVRSPAAGSIAGANEPAALADAIRALLDDPPARQATRRYAEGFGWDAVSAGQSELFETVSAAFRDARGLPRREPARAGAMR